MKLALAQINPTVGDLRGNAHTIIDFARRAHAEGAELAIFPELCVTGYPPQDLLENPLFIQAVERTLEHIAEEVPADLGIIVGAPVRNPLAVGKRLHNAALLYEGGRQVGAVYKKLLPTYDVFDEYRYFEPGKEQQALEWRGLRIGLHVCEDMWNNQDEVEYHLYSGNPIDELAAQDVDLYVNISASPFAVGKHEQRNAHIRNTCREHGIPFVLVNQVGANTEIVFDGDSRVHAADGTRLICAQSFEEDLIFWDTDGDAGPCPMQHDDLQDLHDAVVMGIHDYFEKTGIFTKAIVGLSGGIDSAVTCALAVEALGPERVVGVTMPSKYSSTGSVEDSRVLAENLGIEFHNISIKPAIDAFDEMLAERFAGTEEGVAEENLQSRSRGVTLMALSNKFGYLLLSTGNKSELALGYVTLYGDTNGGVAVLSDVLKTDVYRLARYVNDQAGREVIPENTITKPPSAELRPGQQDQDTLPPYEMLDDVLRRYIEEQEELDTIVEATGYDHEDVREILRRVDQNEYKRRQTPPGLRVSPKAFGVGRRVPIVMRWDRRVVRQIAEGKAAVEG